MIFLSFILKDLFYKSLYTIQYIIRNKIINRTLVNTYTTRYSFIIKKFIEKVFQVLGIKLQQLIKPKQI